MAVKSGWFNAIKTVDPETGDISFDRAYDNEMMNNFFKGLISQNGIFSNVGDKLKVSAAEGMTITVGIGKALAGSHWIDNTAIEPLTVDDADVARPRWDAVMVRFDASVSVRTGSLYIKKGAPMSEPVKPSAEGNYGNGSFDATGGPVELPLAYIYVDRNVTEIKQSNITDNRGASNCPYISHLVIGPDAKDVDKYLADMYDKIIAWSRDLTEELNINTYMSQYTKVVDGGNGVSNTVNLDMAGYLYNPGDVFLVYYNGLLLARDVEYAITEGETYAAITISNGSTQIPKGNRLVIQVIKSLVGMPSFINGDDMEY